MIKKRQIEIYLKAKISPVLGEGWQICDSTSIIRRVGTIIQGIHFDRSGYSDSFYPWYAIQVLAIPADFLHLTLGARFKDSRRVDALVDWAPEDAAQTELLLRLIREQTRPRIDEPLTLEAAVLYIDRAHLKYHHFGAHWSLGVIYGLMGRLDEAARQFTEAENNLKYRAKGWEKVHKPVPQSIIDNLSQLARFKGSLTDFQTFSLFCEESTAKTAAVLKISGSWEKQPPDASLINVTREE